MSLSLALKVAVTVLALFAIPATAVSVEHSAFAKPPAAAGPKLKPKLRDLIRQEMAQLIASTNAIATAIITGDHDTVADQADKIVTGFILKRSLTEQDKEDLKCAVSPAFPELDAAFHNKAADLLKTAKNKAPGLQVTCLSKMMKDCFACHSTYARDRFPSFTPPHMRGTDSPASHHDRQYQHEGSENG